MTYTFIFLAELAFAISLILYLVADTEEKRRKIGLLAILLAVGAALMSLYPLEDKIRLGLDLKGGTSFTLQLGGANGADLNPKAIDQAITVLRRRIDPNGGREILMQPYAGGRIKVDIPGLKADEVEGTRQQLARAAKLEFRLVNPDQSIQNAVLHNPAYAFRPEDAQKWVILKMVQRNKDNVEETTYIPVSRVPEMSGKFVTHSYRSLNQIGEPEVVMEFNDEGKQRFADITGANVGRRFAIVLDNVVKSAPNIKDAITGGRANISGGSMTQLEAEELASVLENPLETAVAIVEERSVDPSLGADSIASGRNAGIIAFLGVVAYMVIYYRAAGVVSVVALLVNLLLLLGLLAQFKFTLSMPGIAGIVLTIGMAVDANVLIYERIRDELHDGKELRHAVDIGFERAFSAIFDSNVTTLIPAAVLAALGTGPLRGFAITLTLGIIANLFAALVVSRNCFDWLLAGNVLKKLTMMQFLRDPKFDFLKYRHAGLIASLVVIGAGAAMFMANRAELVGVDFAGGDSVIVQYQNPVGADARESLGKMREALVKTGINPSQLEITEENTVEFQTIEGQGEAAIKALQTSFPASQFAKKKLDRVGAQVGAEAQQRALFALGLGLLGILIYASLRFEWSFAVAAAVGQLHDVLIALAFMALLGRELTLPLVGAFLTIAGYSINDKIVVFDRIREGLKRREKGTLFEIINRALNLTLARTLLTGGSVVIATIALIIFGGPVIHDFSVAMLIGVLSGIYSSHFISPPLAWWIDAYKEKQARNMPTDTTTPVIKAV